jgi:hypothetical protein
MTQSGSFYGSFLGRDSLVFQVLDAARRRVEHRFLLHHLRSPKPKRDVRSSARERAKR